MNFAKFSQFSSGEGSEQSLGLVRKNDANTRFSHDAVAGPFADRPTVRDDAVDMLACPIYLTAWLLPR